MDQIRNTGSKGLKKAGPPPPPAPSDQRGQLMEDIKSGGFKLHHVETNAETEKPEELEGMALGLQRALQERFQVIHSDSDDSGDDDDDSDDDEWDD